MRLAGGGLIALLSVYWLVLSGHYTALLLVLGAASVALVFWIVRRMDLVDLEGPARLGTTVAWYLPWLVIQVFVSALAVARLVWSPRPVLRPAVGRAPLGDESELLRVVYANSITLTPGTLSLSLDEEAVTVHSLDPAGLDQLRGGAMLRRVRRLEAR